MPRVPFDDLRLDSTTWERGTPARRHEWRMCLDEVLHEGQFEWDEPSNLHLPRPRWGMVRLAGVGPASLKIDRVHFELCLADDPQAVPPHPLGTVPVGEIQSLMDDYMQICRDMSKLKVGSASPRLEALDIAKRLTHDEAGQTIATQLGELKPDLGTARRLFTLFVTLFHDTTKLAAPSHLHHA